MINLSYEELKTVTLKFLLIIFFIVPFIPTASALTITYSAKDLLDGGQGDLWQYDYFFSGYSFKEFEGFTIFFDYNLYGSLSP